MQKLSILESKDVLLCIIVTVTIISHRLNKAKTRHGQAMRQEHITNQAYRKQWQHQNKGNSPGPAHEHTPEKFPPQEPSLLKTLNQTRKLVRAQHGMHSIHTIVALNINQRKIYKIYKIRKPYFM